MDAPTLPRRRLAQILACAADTSQRAAAQWLRRELIDADIARRIRAAAAALEITESELGRPLYDSAELDA